VHDVLRMREELLRMQREVGELKEQLRQFFRARADKMDLFRQVRWAETCNPAVGLYPTDPATVFPIQFLDAHFDAAPGNQVLSTAARQSSQATTCFSATYLANGTKLPVFWLRGLGEDGDEGEWFAFPSTAQAQQDAGIPLFNIDNQIIQPFRVLEVLDTIDIGGTSHLRVRYPRGGFKTKWIVNGVNAIPPYPGFGDLSTYTGRGFWRTDQDDAGPVATSLDMTGVLIDQEFGLQPTFATSLPGTLQKFAPGFTALGESYLISGTRVINCRQRPVTTVFGKNRTAATQTAAGDAQTDIDIFFRGQNGKMQRAGFVVICYLPFLEKGETLKVGTWGKADWYSGHWEGDFDCDPDTLDTQQQGGGQQGDGGGQGGGGGGQQQLLELMSSGSTGTGTGTF